MSENVVLDARELTKIFGSGRTSVRAVDDVTFVVRRGEIVLVKGPSGSGKTTLLSMLGGLMRPTSGDVRILGRSLSSGSGASLADLRLRKIGFVFQAYNLLGALTAEHNILFPARLAGADIGVARARAHQLIDRLNLSKRRHATPDKLSGGEKQRVAVARALINDAPLLLADEPTGNLDSRRGLEVVMILHDLARDEGRSVVIVTHDARIEDVADRVLWLEDGKLRDLKTESHDWIHDPVCGMRIDKLTASRTSTFGGESYFFCSERCKGRFDADPTSFSSN